MVKNVRAKMGFCQFCLSSKIRCICFVYGNAIKLFKFLLIIIVTLCNLDKLTINALLNAITFALFLVKYPFSLWYGGKYGKTGEKIKQIPGFGLNNQQLLIN